MPDNWRAGIIAFAPGTVVMSILFLIQNCTSLNPGSDIKGDPASEIKTIDLFFKSFDNLFMIFFSL